MTFGQYLRESRDLSLNVFLILPALVAYEVGVYAMGPDVRNGADLLLRELFQMLGPPGMLILNAVVIASATVCALDAIDRFDFLLSRFVYLALECLAYAAVLGPLVLLVKSPLADLGAPLATAVGGPSVWERVVLAFGAGAYEELFFRLLLMGALYQVFFGILREAKWAAAAAALVTSSAFFSLCHHDVILAGGEPFDLHIFLFRSVAGLILGFIFFTRGLAAAVYTHAFYNLLVFFR